MNIYLAGPMRGIPEFNFPKFNEVTSVLRLMGHTVFNPAEKDNERHGTDISKGNLTGSEEVAASNHGFNLREALRIDMEFICDEADAIVLLPGWEKSKGANAERATGVALGHQLYEWPDCPPSVAANIHVPPRAPTPKPTRYIDPGYIVRMDQALGLVREELIRAREKYGPMKSTHEGYSVLKEKVDELWDDIKANKFDLLAESTQVAAMGLSFMVDLCQWPDPYCTRDGACGIDHGVCNGIVRHDP